MAHVTDTAQLDSILQQSVGQLVVVQFTAPAVCESGLQDGKMDPTMCVDLRDKLEVVAAEVPDITFVSVEVPSKSERICREMGVTTLPCLQFYSGNVKVFQHDGFHKLSEELGEGVLYYGGAAAGNQKASDWVADLHTREELQAFLAQQPAEVLAVVDVSTYMCEPCMHIYPAVLQMARSFVGYAGFARLIGEEDGVYEKLLEELRIAEVPTFLFFKSGKEVGRHSGDSRELIVKIIGIQQQYGIQPPQPAHRRRPGTKGVREKPARKKNLWGSSSSVL